MASTFLRAAKHYPRRTWNLRLQRQTPKSGAALTLRLACSALTPWLEKEEARFQALAVHGAKGGWTPKKEVTTQGARRARDALSA